MTNAYPQHMTTIVQDVARYGVGVEVVTCGKCGEVYSVGWVKHPAYDGKYMPVACGHFKPDDAGRLVCRECRERAGEPIEWRVA